MVQYQTHLNDIVYFVDSGDIRPVPPENDVTDGRKFEIHEKVDVLRDGCWMKGTILGILYEGLKYLVEIDGGDDVPIEVGRSCLRVHRDWCDGFWNPPFDYVQRNSVKMEQNAICKPETITEVRTHANSRKVKLRFKGAERLLKAKFSPKTAVEVKSDQDGYQGSWYTAIVVGSAGVGKFLVEYQTLKTDDEMELLKEVANEQDIRPCPPEIPRHHRYTAHEEVDAWYNDGWWEGVIYEVLDDWKYIVFFASTSEKLVYQHPNLRPHQNWVDGKWVLALPNSINEMNFASEEALRENFREGMLIEVRNDDAGDTCSWYTATIIGFVEKKKFLVEYDSLKTNDEKHTLRREVSAIDVRPLPPCNLHFGRYKCSEEVDAWRDGGWWVGAVSEVLNRNKYIVQFSSAGDKWEYDHMSLRPHQDWIDGKWITHEHRSSDLKLRTSSSERRCAQSEADRSFGKGTTVEVKSNEPGYEGSWYTAVIVRSTRKGTYLVEYLTLKTEDERESLREETEAQNIRPCPPKIEVSGCYFLLEKVDAWYNDGWWEGVISKVLADKKYMVYFETSREELEFDDVYLRTRQEWINGRWIAANKV
ncbi:hypothetical protein BVRB_3g054660 [Beta vulgaris subsp. vulgaris]|nr:hypothetical protein BVRB_3g054660 [Beta vulgaris subsp. vulgaris]